jgi:hypothetical protein
MDILAACILVIRTGHTHATGILKFIASGVFGQSRVGWWPFYDFCRITLSLSDRRNIRRFFFWIYPKIQIAKKLAGYGLRLWNFCVVCYEPRGRSLSRGFKAY